MTTETELAAAIHAEAEFVKQWPKHVEPFLKAGGFDLYKKRYTGSEARFRSQLESGIPPHLVVLDADARFIPVALADLTGLREWLEDKRRFLMGRLTWANRPSPHGHKRDAFSKDVADYLALAIHDGVEWLAFFGCERPQWHAPTSALDADAQLSRLLGCIPSEGGPINLPDELTGGDASNEAPSEVPKEQPPIKLGYLGIWLDEKTQAVFRDGCEEPVLLQSSDDQWSIIAALVRNGDSGLDLEERNALGILTSPVNWRKAKERLNPRLQKLALKITEGRLWKLIDSPEA